MRKTRERLIVVATVIWAGSFLDAVFDNGTTLFGLTTPVMLVIVTAVFAINQRNGNGNGSRE